MRQNKKVEWLLGEERARFMQLYESGYTSRELVKEYHCATRMITYVLHTIYGAELVRSNKINRAAAKRRVATADLVGYRWCKIPDWYTGKGYNSGAIPEHTIVYCATHNITELPPFHVVHHIDLNKWNNTPENLQLMTNQAHIFLHWRLNKEAGKTCLTNLTTHDNIDI